MRRLAALVLIPLASTLAGCAVTTGAQGTRVPDSRAASPSGRLQRALRQGLYGVQGDLGALQRSWSMITGGVARDARVTRDHAAAFPAWLSREMREGSATLEADLEGIYQGFLEDVHSFPRAMRRLAYLAW